MKRFPFALIAIFAIALFCCSCNEDEPARVHESYSNTSTFRPGLSSRVSEPADADATPGYNQ